MKILNTFQTFVGARLASPKCVALSAKFRWCEVSGKASLAPTMAILLMAIPAHAATDWRVQPVSSLQKLTAKTRGVLEPFKAAPAQLRAAKGEWECFQVVMSAGDVELKNVRLSSTPLATHLGEFIARKNIRIYRENYVFADKPSGNKRIEKLWWPDALIPLDLQKEINIAPGKSEVFWVAMQAPREASEGEYYGAIDIAANGKTKQLFVSLTVDKAAMPKATMRGNVAVYYDILRDWYSKNWRELSDEEFAEMKKQYYEFLLDYRINAYDLPVDWSTPAAAKYLRDERVLSSRLPPISEPENLKTAMEVLRQNNAISKNFYYRIDEPMAEDFPRIQETTKALRVIDAQIKHCVTVHPNETLEGAVDIWCPNIGDFFGIGHLDSEWLAEERKKGNETWWYTMVEPKYPYPTWLLDDDAVAVRSYGALMARYGISGFVYSMAHGWGPKPLENLESFDGTNGDGTLLYPSEIIGDTKTLRGPMPSIRLMLLRDAIEDYELIKAGIKKSPPFPNGLLREKIVPAKITIPACRGEACLAQNAARLNEATKQSNRARQASPLQFAVAHDAKNLYVSFRATASTLEKDWCAIDLAPLDAGERFRFIVTGKNSGIVERHTGDGHFRLPDFQWKFSAKKIATGYEVEMQIPLSVVVNEKSSKTQFRFNALRRIRSGSTPLLLRAFPDANDVTLLPIATLK